MYHAAMDLCDPTVLPASALEKRLAAARSALQDLARSLVEGDEGEVRQATLWPVHETGVDENLDPLPGEGEAVNLGVFLAFPAGGIVGFLAEPEDNSREGLLRCELVAVVAVTGILAERFLRDGEEDDDTDDSEDVTTGPMAPGWGMPVGEA